jgi:glycosyltransferase involved in cell wall biosynthesis
VGSRLGIRENATCRVESVPEDEGVRHYAVADIYIFLSVHEPFGIVGLEALSMAVPIVVGILEVVVFLSKLYPRAGLKWDVCYW